MRPREMYHYDGKTDLSKMRDDAIKLSKGGYASRSIQDSSKQEVLIHLHGHDATCFLYQENALAGQKHEYYKDGQLAWKKPEAQAALVKDIPATAK